MSMPAPKTIELMDRNCRLRNFRFKKTIIIPPPGWNDFYYSI